MRATIWRAIESLHRREVLPQAISDHFLYRTRKSRKCWWEPRFERQLCLFIGGRRYRRRFAYTHFKELPPRDQAHPRNVLGCQASPCSALHAQQSLSAAVYFFFKVWSEIKLAERGRNCIFGRTFTYRKNLFSRNPNELNCERLGFQGAKDAYPPQDDLK